jgi:hypothetical protein
VAHALLRAAFALMRTLGSWAKASERVHMSVNTARKSAQCHLVFLRLSERGVSASSPLEARIGAAFAAAGKRALSSEV